MTKKAKNQAGERTQKVITTEDDSMYNHPKNVAAGYGPIANPFNATAEKIAHTWYLSPADEDGSSHLIVAGRSIGRITTINEKYRNLIAAAPELNQALKDIISALQDTTDRSMTRKDRDALIREIASEAIAKAD